MPRLSTDLVWVAVVATLAFVSRFLPVGDAVHSLLAGPAVLLLPGYALAAALLPRLPSSLERLLLGLGLSLALAVVGGLLLNLTAALDSTTRSEEHTSELQSRLHLVC